MTDPLEHLLPRDHFKAACILVVVSILIAGYIGVVDWWGVGWERGFTISAVTERVAVTIEQKGGVSTRLSPQLNVTRLGLHLMQSSLLHLPDGAELDVARRGNGTAYLQLENLGPNGGATITAANGQVFDLDVNDTLQLNATPGEAPNFILPFRGAVRLAPEVREAVGYLLLSGEVTAYEKLLLGGRHAVLTTSLTRGDVVRWKGSPPWRGSQGNVLPQQASGFIQVGEGTAINVVAHVVASRLVVWRYGAKQYNIAPSIYSTIAGDPVVSEGFVPVVALLGGWLMAYEGFVKLWGAAKGRNKADSSAS